MSRAPQFVFGNRALRAGHTIPILGTTCPVRSGIVAVIVCSARVLKDMRARYDPSDPDQREIDLSDGQVFDWRSFLAGRPDAQEVIGPGVVSFGFMYVNSMDCLLYTSPSPRD